MWNISQRSPTVLCITFAIILVLAACLLTQSSAGVDKEKTPSIASFTKGMRQVPGYFKFYWDDKTGKIWLEIDRWETVFLHVHSLPHGIGSNDIGLDRGQWGESRVVYFQRIGPKVLLIQSNYDYRAETNNAQEKQAVKESFAKSILWGFKVAAEDGNKVLVDATEFLLSDIHHVANTLQSKKQGSYKIDSSRSAIFPANCKNFTANTELQAVLTFTGKPAGEFIKSVVPSADSVTVHQHHSFIKLPDDQYQPRAFHPQCGYFWIEYKDYAAPLSTPLEKRYIRRHRLEKKNPNAKISEPVKPIVYYLDRGAPEPIRSALLEGAGWWNEAFEEAGYKNAFQIKLLPKDIDPMDARYNVIQWVHRSTRGWSYGRSIYDPRTGEILRGHVTLGSLRVRQDILIAEGLLAPFKNGTKVSKTAEQMALARLKQLSAHEVGHTLGLAHNFAASTKGDASVMDYPHPKINIIGDRLDVSKAYSTGVGAWDKTAIVYGYSDFPKAVDESKALHQILANARQSGLDFISDRDARPASGAHPLAHLWDNGPDPIAELKRLMKIRNLALKQFGVDNIPAGQPLAVLEERLVPVYLLHRYQVEAVAKILGGVQYTYAHRDEGKTETQPVASAAQTAALLALRETLSPKALALPEKLINLIPPRPQGYGKHRELFDRNTGPAFDTFAPAEACADHVIGMILHPARCTRLVEQHALDNSHPGLGKVIDLLLEDRWKCAGKDNQFEAIERVVDYVLLYRLMALAANEDAAKQVRAVAHHKLKQLEDKMETNFTNARNATARAHYHFGLVQLRQFAKNPQRVPLPKPIEMPPGSPIGCSGGCWCGSK